MKPFSFTFLVLTLRLGLGLMALSQPTRAGDCPICDPYLTFITEKSLAKDVGLIGMAALSDAGNTFGADAQKADALLREIKNNAAIPPECRRYVESKIRSAPFMKVVATGALQRMPPAFNMTYSYPSTLMSVKYLYFAANNPCTPLRSAATTAYTSCLQAAAPAAYATFSQNLATGSTSQIQQQVLTQTGYAASATDVLLLKAENAAINAGTAAGLRSWSAAQRKALSPQQFMDVVAMVGWDLNNSYSFARDNSVGTAGQGIVTVTQALTSLKTDAQYMIWGSNDPASSIADYAVVCRDAAVVQAEMLQAYGFKYVHIVGYRSDTGGHADVISQYPNVSNTLGRVGVLNWYGTLTRSNVDGAQALFQGSGSGIPDYSSQYEIANANGRVSGDVPSEAMKFLNEAAGGSNSTWDPLTRATNSMLAMQVSPGSKGSFQGRMLYGTDGNGMSYAGGAGSGTWGLGTNLPGEAGFVIAQQLRPASVTGQIGNGTALYAYGQVEQHLRSNPIQVSKDIKAVVEGHVALAGNLSLVTGGPDYAAGGISNNLNADSDHRIGGGIEATQTALHGRLKVVYTAGGDIMIGQSDIRDADPTSYTIVPLGGYATARAMFNTRSVMLIGQVMTAVSQLDGRDKAEVGIASRHLAATVFESGRMWGSLLEDNTLKRVGSTITAQPWPWLRLNLTGEVPVEGTASLAGVRILGSGEFNW